MRNHRHTEDEYMKTNILQDFRVSISVPNISMKFVFILDLILSFLPVSLVQVFNKRQHE